MAAKNQIPAPISLLGESILADPSGAAWLPAWQTLIVSDLHLEKGSAYLTRGVPLPPFDSAETLRRLTDAIGRLQPRCVIALGDSFHDAKGEARMESGERAQLAGLVAGCDFIWIIGNHDPVPPDNLGGCVKQSHNVGALTLTHEPTVGVPGQVAGHLHPVAKVGAGGRRFRRRCFVSDGKRLILPAFGAYAGGLNVLDDAFAPFLGRRFHVWMIGDADVYKIASDRLLPDRS